MGLMEGRAMSGMAYMGMALMLKSERCGERHLTELRVLLEQDEPQVQHGGHYLRFARDGAPDQLGQMPQVVRRCKKETGTEALQWMFTEKEV